MVENLYNANPRPCLNARITLTREHFFLVSCLFNNVDSEGCQNTTRCRRQPTSLYAAATWSWGIVRSEEAEKA